ncbi:uncharacterized protein (DUF305 family) [Actinoplanes lutulentus]|uniref:Uncharacterized protein (DUF305 family) n=1 Tax=Actinoplanes lutulentus TaxID=1287878 RepID=A0A327YXV1_9ACTN|nr:DUF305 domain-containing protein [Actinoplanes lutulentus]MBB2946445.1 uncharacterized protein (DUF305 family) [Actinoplanes lutulentus]RAK25421.1 uncharacterized protein (DUF305 family) [Actinoplanes lutulentus]
MIRRLAAVLSLAATGLTVFLLRDTGTAEPVVRTEAAAPTAVDEHYARMMVAHHEQAVGMSRTLIDKGAVPERIRLIAEFIERDQQREIDVTNEWLIAWGRPATGPLEAGPMEAEADHGMLTAAQLGELDRAGVQTAPDVFLRLMIEHHRGAITMSRSLLDAGGGNTYIRGMAKHVINEQTAENDAMTALLVKEPSPSGS